MPVDIGYLRAHREQIFAEALECYRDGEIWHLEWQSQYLLNELQEAYIIDDPWAMRVREAIVVGKNTTSEIMQHLELPVSQQHTGNARRISQICKESGYRQVIRDGSRVWTRK